MFCRDIGLENYVVETDSETVIKQIVKGGNSESRYGGILDSIEVLVSASRNLTFQCASTKANRVAWVLANEALGIPDRAVWKEDAQICIRELVALAVALRFCSCLAWSGLCCVSLFAFRFLLCCRCLLALPFVAPYSGILKKKKKKYGLRWIIKC